MLHFVRESRPAPRFWPVAKGQTVLLHRSRLASKPKSCVGQPGKAARPLSNLGSEQSPRHLIDSPHTLLNRFQ